MVEELKPKTGGKVVKGSSIPLILPNNLKYNASTAGVEKVPGAKRTSLHVVPEASELLEGIKEPVSVLSICGPCRSGKSYILSRLLGTADAFELGHLWDSQTYGIWMGTKVLRGKNFTIVLLDTEGIDAAGASADQDASILVLTTLLSSQLIYNSLSVPYKRDLENMQCFIKLARGISVRKGGVTRISAFHEFFPDFLWLLRDVSLKMENEDGEEMDPTEYLKIRVLGRPSSDEFDDESISDKVGRAILTVFPSVECATLERPSHIANNIPKHTDSLNPDFNKGVNALTERLLLKSRAKRSYDKGSTVSGVALSFMVNHYVEAVNDPNSIPALDNTWQNIVELMRTKAIEEVVDEYNRQMQAQVATATNNWQDPLEESQENKRRGLRRATSRASGRGGLTARNPPSQLTLMELHNELLNKVTSMLLERVGQFGISAEKRSSENEDLIDELQKRLVVREEQTVDYVAVDGTRRKEKGFVVTGGELLKYIQQNKELSKTFCQKLFERLFNQIRERVESPPEDYDFEQLLGELENTRQEYNEQARGPEKWTVLQEMTPSIEKLKVNFEKIVGYRRKAQQKAQEAKLKAKELAREKDELLKQALDMKETQEENLKNMYRLHEQQIMERNQQTAEEKGSINTAELYSNRLPIYPHIQQHQDSFRLEATDFLDRELPWYQRVVK
ncbi:Guanylate-binding protein 5 [Branchiostoma belcheri]|nr:Guanylate-binding protein 5 [Branchiostoma belcheri]